jgi:hypothetical protein
MPVTGIFYLWFYKYQSSSQNFQSENKSNLITLT